MEEENNKNQYKNKKLHPIKTYPIPLCLEEVKENVTSYTNTPDRPSKEQIINHARKLHQQGNIPEATKCYQQIMNQGCNDPRVFSNYGAILKSFGKLEEAELSTRKAIELNPNYANAYSNLGIIQNDLGKSQEAESSYRKAIELNPNLVDAYFNLFLDYEKTNNLQKLKKSIKEFNDIDCIENELFLFRSRLNFRNKDYKTAKELINSISNEWLEKSNNIQKLTYWTYKAFIEEKIENYDIAYSCFQKSQDHLLYSRLSKNSYLNIIDSYKKNIINKTINIKNSNYKFEETNIVFLIGFPRSGTTLLDTILRSHKEIEVIEEKPIISNIETIIKKQLNTKIDNLYSISDDNIIMLRRKYFEIMREFTTKERKLIIDKLPLNTVKLPLINLLFPNAKIIFAHRHPYDTVLSCFQQSFDPNIAMLHFIDLKSSSIMYDQVMGAWDIYKNNISLDFITSKYEHLIEDFDKHTFKILNFLDIKWDDNIRNYRKTALDRGKINTPSSSQVVQPLYKSSIEKWKNYEKYFKDCHQYLEKWVSYFDY
ncbi:tetratricopeptide repeat-containing sulfotransferase family protein [Prochlorococcus marinus]|uniref:tetratricopeptide repeat-containing sulfotransferase family protein n=1 Tax=Prochlorococcus marinus TaxID=1219 RepID=UPI0022B48A0C|nr:sulfotransferase family protein [Prochlorococcus marinus]